MSIGIVTNMTYDFQGRLLTVTVDPGANQAVTSFEYDAISQITKVTRPDGSGNTDYVRDDRGLVTQTTDGRGIITNMTYDNASRILTRTYPAASAENLVHL